MRVHAVLAIVAAIVSFDVAGPARADGDGEAVFKRTCGICHTVQPGVNRLGPSLAGVVGRKAGSVPGFNYSDAMKASGVTWTKETLDKYIADPKGFVPGNRMPYGGLKNDSDRAAVIGYLAAQK